MPSEPEVHFCNVCNQSIPESALSTGAAVRVEGRIVPVATPDAAVLGHPSPPRSALVSAVLVVVVAVAAAVIYLDWRMTGSEGRVRGAVAAVVEPIDRQGQQVDALDRRLAQTAVASDLGPLRDAITDAREILRADVQEIDASMERRLARLDEIRTLLQKLDEAQVQAAARLALVQDELRVLVRDIGELKARPAAAAVVTPSPRESTPGSPPADVAGPAGLPADLAHHASRLTDPDDGTRFEAVDQLLQSKDPRVYPLLLPLAKDPDMFVRRLVLEGLAEHRSAESVDALLVALADPEEVVRHTAYLGLKRSTGQDIAFDPGASADQRGAMQRRWKQWWDKNRAGF